MEDFIIIGGLFLLCWLLKAFDGIIGLIAKIGFLVFGIGIPIWIISLIVS